MTKTLTEQFRDGELEYGYYYIKHTFGYKPFGVMVDFWHGPFDKWGAIPNDYVLEVLAPVPSYDEWQAELDSNNELLNVQKRLEKKIKLLEEQLNCALETMGQVAKLSDNTVDAVQCAHAICLINERLKEIKEVK